MLHPGEFRIRFSDVDGNFPTRTFSYSNGQTSTASLTAVTGSLGEEISGAKVTLEGPKGKLIFPASLSDTGVVSVTVPSAFLLSFATNYTLTLAGFSPFWGADAIMINSSQTLSFKTIDVAFEPPQTCGVHGNATCLLTTALCAWNTPCILGATKQKYFFENPANTLTYTVLTNNYLETPSASFRRVFKAAGVSGVLDTSGGFDFTGEGVESVRFSNRGDAYIDFSLSKRCYRAVMSKIRPFALEIASITARCSAFSEPSGDWAIPSGGRIDRSCSVTNRCAITSESHYVNDRATNDFVNGQGWVFSRSFEFTSFLTGAFGYRKYWLDIGPIPQPFTYAPTDPKTLEANKLGKAKKAFWVSDDLYIETDSGTCFHVNWETFATCPI